MASPSIALCQDGRLATLEKGTHWVHHEEPARVNVLIDTFLREGQAR
jgi:pimeloyl-ACP methyl ester carboxylesterase